jgi:hypothetical protein
MMMVYLKNDHFMDMDTGDVLKTGLCTQGKKDFYFRCFLVQGYLKFWIIFHSGKCDSKLEEQLVS